MLLFIGRRGFFSWMQKSLGVDLMEGAGGCLIQLLHFLGYWIKIREHYDRICEDGTRRETSISMGVRSIVQTLICTALTVACFYGGVWMATHFFTVTYELFTFIFWITAVVGLFAMMAFSVLFGIVGGFFYMYYQFRLNRRAIRWIALVVWIIGVGLAIAGTIWLWNIINQDLSVNI